MITIQHHCPFRVNPSLPWCFVHHGTMMTSYTRAGTDYAQKPQEAKEYQELLHNAEARPART